MPPAETISETVRVAWKVNPFLHIDAGRIYNPLTDRALVPADPEYAAFQAFLRGEPVDDALPKGGWVVRAADDVSTRYHLKIVSLELMTRCNQKCYFCPVSIAPREDYDMPEELFERIVVELTAFKTIEATLQALTELHRQLPNLDLSSLHPALDELARNSNIGLQSEAERTRLALGKK